MGGPVWAIEPTQVINYVSCHDNHTLFDKLQLTCPDASLAELVAMNKIASAIVITSQGVPFFQAGEEILRTKEKADGTFDHNSYASPSSLNAIKWDDLNKAEYADVHDYYKGLIEFRMNHAALRMSSSSDISKYMNIFMNGSNDQNVIAYELSGEANGEISDGIIVVFNPSAEAAKVDLPEGEWKICVNGEKAGTEVLGTATGSVDVNAVSTMILVKGAVKLSDDVQTDTPTTDNTNDTTTPAPTASNESPSTGDSPLSTILFVVLALSVISVIASIVLGKKKTN